MEKETESMKTFDMGSLRTNLPQKRGLSRYYSGKARSFACIGDVKCLEDLKKIEHPEAKKRKKLMEKQEKQIISPYPCRRESSNTQCTTPCVGV